MTYCCTYFDANYLTRGLALYRSLEPQGTPFRLWMLCLDDETHAILTRLALPHATLVTVAELEEHIPALKTARGNRSKFEYYATVKAPLMKMLLEKHPEIDLLHFFDADFQFFANPALIGTSFPTAAAILSPHRLTHDARSEKLLRHGKYNAGFVAFRRSKGGMEPLSWWCDRVIEWCHDRVEGEKFADQGYLTQMPSRFPYVVDATHPGINAAPWNLDQRPLSNALLINGQPLIFFHCHGVRRIGPRLYDTGTAPYRIAPSAAWIRLVYKPYIRELRAIIRELTTKYGYQPREGSVRHPLSNVLSSPGLLLSRLRKGQWILG